MKYAVAATVVGGIAAANLSSGLIKSLYGAFAEPVYAQETDVLEIPYDTNPIPEFQTQEAETVPSFYDENRWKDVPSITWNYLPPVYYKVDKLPQMYSRFDDRWLEVLLDAPNFTEKTGLKGHFTWFLFDTLSTKNLSAGAPGLYNFKVIFSADEKLNFGEFPGAVIYGTFFEPGDYRYRWSFGPTGNSSENHVIYNILFDKKKLTQNSSTMLLQAFTTDNSDAYEIMQQEVGFETIHFSDTLKVPEFSNPLIPWIAAVALFFAVSQKRKK